MTNLKNKLCYPEGLQQKEETLLKKAWCGMTTPVHCHDWQTVLKSLFFTWTHHCNIVYIYVLYMNCGTMCVFWNVKMANCKLIKLMIYWCIFHSQAHNNIQILQIDNTVYPLLPICAIYHTEGLITSVNYCYGNTCHFLSGKSKIFQVIYIIPSKKWMTEKCLSQ